MCTGEHPFYIVNKGWVKARDLIETDEVIHYNEKVSKIDRINKEVLDTPEETYNFEVEDYHTYYVTNEDVLVHNDCIGDLSDATFAQKDYKEVFSSKGIQKYSELAGKQINTIDDLADAIKSGLIKPSNIQLDYIVRDGNKLILNTRTSQSLIRAGVPRSTWVGINRTGNLFYEQLLTNQLIRNGLTSSGWISPISLT